MSKNNKNSNSLFDFFDSLLNKGSSYGTTVSDPNLGNLGSHTSPTFPVHRVVSPPLSLPLSLPTYGGYASGAGSIGSMFGNYVMHYCNFDIVNIEDFKKFKLEGMVFHDNIIMTFEDFYNRKKESIEKAVGIPYPTVVVKVPCNCFVCEEKARLAESLADMSSKQDLSDNELEDKLNLIELYKQQIQKTMAPISLGNNGYSKYNGMWTPIGPAIPAGIKFNPKDIYTASDNRNIPDCQNTYHVNFCIFNNNIEDAFKLVEFIADTHDSNKHLVNPRSYNQDCIDLYIKKYNLEKSSREYELKHKTNNEVK